MFIGGVFVKKLRLTRDQLLKYLRFCMLGTWLWMFLLIVNMATWFLAGSESVLIWDGALTFMRTMVMTSYSALGVLAIIMINVYDHGHRKPYGAIICSIMLCMVIGFCVGWGCPKNWPMFVQLCQIAPSHLGFIIPLGLVVEYLTCAGCAVIRILLDWRADRHSWRMVNAMIEHNADSDEPYSNDTDGANVAIDGQLSFAAFASYFN